ncbi:putative villin/Gelsolin [Helianthus annuus]|nr:putative villin/Gelsolin [Helianthus annuus]
MFDERVYEIERLILIILWFYNMKQLIFKEFWGFEKLGFVVLVDLKHLMMLVLAQIFMWAKALEVIQFLKDKYHEGICNVAIVDHGKLQAEGDSGEIWVIFCGFAPIGKKVLSDDDVIPKRTPGKLYRNEYVFVSSRLYLFLCV